MCRGRRIGIFQRAPGDSRTSRGAFASRATHESRMGIRGHGWELVGMTTTTISVRRETALFRVLVGVIGLRVLDDTILQPAPGTSFLDHPVSALVPLTLL